MRSAGSERGSTNHNRESALPATAAVTWSLNQQGFLSAQFIISPDAIAGWLAVVVAASALAALPPARRAARLTVREALAAS